MAGRMLLELVEATAGRSSRRMPAAIVATVAVVAASRRCHSAAASGWWRWEMLCTVTVRWMLLKLRLHLQRHLLRLVGKVFVVPVAAVCTVVLVVIRVRDFTHGGYVSLAI